MPRTPDLAYAFDLAPKGAIEYFRSLGYTVTDDWLDTAAAVRARGFAVSKSGSLDVLHELHQGLTQALQKGETQTAFTKRMGDALAAKGWAEASPWRLGTIYRTNVQSALMAGRWQAFQSNKAARPYLQYVAVMDARTRPSHAAMNGLVFHIDDPIWQTHYPPCGYNCRCRVRALAQRDIERLGLRVLDSKGDTFTETVVYKDGRFADVFGYRTPPKPVRVALRDSAEGALPKVERGQMLLWEPAYDPAWAPGEGSPWEVQVRRLAMRTDPGFGFNQATTARWDVGGDKPDALPGAAASAASTVVRMVEGQKTWRDFGRSDLRRVVDADREPAPPLLPKAPSREAALASLAAALRVSEASPVRAVQTPIEPVLIDYSLLGHVVAKEQDARERFGYYMLSTLAQPYEVYLTEYEDGFRSRYIGLFQGDQQLLVVARINRDGTVLWNIMHGDEKALNKARVGELQYTREEGKRK